MKIEWFLRLKHWQIFLVFVLSIILSGLFAKYPIVSVILFSLYIGWIYLIGHSFKKKAKSKNSRPLSEILIAIIYISIIVLIVNYNPQEMIESSTRTIIHFVSGGIFNLALSILIYRNMMIFIQNTGKHDDRIKWFLLFLFMYIGVWYIQPEINKLIEDCRVGKGESHPQTSHRTVRDTLASYGSS